MRDRDGAVWGQMGLTIAFEAAAFLNVLLPFGRILRGISLGSGVEFHGIRVLLVGLGRRTGRGAGRCGRGCCCSSGGGSRMGGPRLEIHQVIIVPINEIGTVSKSFW